MTSDFEETFACTNFCSGVTELFLLWFSFVLASKNWNVMIFCGSIEYVKKIATLIFIVCVLINQFGCYGSNYEGKSYCSDGK